MVLPEMNNYIVKTKDFKYKLFNGLFESKMIVKRAFHSVICGLLFFQKKLICLTFSFFICF